MMSRLSSHGQNLLPVLIVMIAVSAWVAATGPVFADPLAELTEVDGFLGVVLAETALNISPQIDGVLTAVTVKVGDQVTAGQTLFRLDDVGLRHEVDIARAMVQSSVADAAKARVANDLAAKLLARRTGAANAYSAEEIEQAAGAARLAAAELEGAEARVAEQRARLALLESRLARTRGTSPITGRVSIRYLEPGATVETMTPVVRIVGSAPPFIRFSIPPSDLPSFSVGAHVQARVPGRAVPVPAVVRAVAPEVDSAIDMILVEADLAVGAAVTAALRPGTVVKVQPVH